MGDFIDVHCHILPGVDDGSTDMEMTRQMLQTAWKDGIRCMIATPHYREGRMEATPAKLISSWEKTAACAREIHRDFVIYLGSELYSTHALVSSIEKRRALTINGSRYVLVEFNPSKGYSEIETALRELQMSGYRPVLAHVERYKCLVKEPYRVEELTDMGIYIQVNASSVTGDMGFASKAFIKKLMKYELVHFVGTDAHNMGNRKPAMQKCVSYVAKKFGEDYARRISWSNALRMLNNEPV